jgi:deoxyribodipyrimidine photo-lyase
MTQSPRPALVWFRQDLRLADNPALDAAARAGPVIALYVLDDETPGSWKIGGASRWWLHHSLETLSAALARRGVPLILRRGKAAQIVPEMVATCDAEAVFWNRCYEPFAIARDASIKAQLTKAGIKAESCNGALLAEPWTIKTQSGGPFRVFTPFWNALRASCQPPAPLAVPPFADQAKAERGDRLEDWGLLPTRPDWAGGLRESWTPGEDGAQAALAHFLQHGLDRYQAKRDQPGVDAVSQLSPHLHWGEISVRQVWRAAEAHGGPEAEAFLRQLGWREFSASLLWQFPKLPEQPMAQQFAAFPWRDDPAGLKAWQRGQTGYPLVDAGMRQLWTTGWMHNRVRLVTASFLIKHLLVPWTAGEAWFWDTLVDADLANNAASWQWVAGSGADAAPYFRIFNPVLQGEKFDPDGAYVRRWVPELARMPDRWLHKPWQAPVDRLAEAGVRLGRTYPHPIVEHDAARERALAALAEISA